MSTPVIAPTSDEPMESFEDASSLFSCQSTLLHLCLHADGVGQVMTGFVEKTEDVHIKRINKGPRGHPGKGATEERHEGYRYWEPGWRVTLLTCCVPTHNITETVVFEEIQRRPHGVSHYRTS